MVSVKMCELSLNKARNADVNVEGVDSKWLQGHGFGEALSAGIFDKPAPKEDARQFPRERELHYTRVLENDEVMVEIADEVRIRVVKTTIADVRSKTEPSEAKSKSDDEKK